MKWRENSVSVLMGVSVVVLVGLTLNLLKENNELDKLVQDQLAGKAKPFYMLPYQDLILRHTTLVRQSESEVQTTPQMHLVVIGSDKCTYTAASMEAWRTILRAASRNVDVWYVTLDSSQFITSLVESQKRNYPYQIRHIGDRKRFMLHTGIVGTPQTLLLDRMGRIVFTQSREPLAELGSWK